MDYCQNKEQPEAIRNPTKISLEQRRVKLEINKKWDCLLYTSDAADEQYIV